MPTFDIVSEVDHHEVTNAIDQANREINNRFDFKNAQANFLCSDCEITLKASNDFHIKQMIEILESKWTKRTLDIKALKKGNIESNLSEARLVIYIKHGIDKEDAKKIVKFIKDSKTKTQGSIQGEQVCVSGKKKDALQTVMQLIKKNNFSLPLQFTNFRA